MQCFMVFDIPYVFAAYKEKLADGLLVVCPAAQQLQDDEPGTYNRCAPDQGIVAQAL